MKPHARTIELFELLARSRKLLEHEDVEADIDVYKRKVLQGTLDRTFESVRTDSILSGRMGIGEHRC